jgi:hypothetical protein
MKKVGIDIYAQRRPDWRPGIELLITHNSDIPGKRSVGRVVFEAVENENMIAEDFPIGLSDESAQVLMDRLWDCGLRPSEGTGSAGSLRKTEDHLKDMRKIVSKILEVQL